MSEYDDSNEFTEDELRYIKAEERKEKKNMYRESRAEVLEFEAEIQAEQRGATIWQGVRQAAGLKSQEEFLQLQRTDPARANLMISDYHKELAGDLRSGSQQRQVTSQTPQAPRQPQGGMGFPTAGKGNVSPERVVQLKERGREAQLTDDELLDVLDGILK